MICRQSISEIGRGLSQTLFPNPIKCVPVYISSGLTSFETLSPTASSLSSSPSPMLISPLQWSPRHSASAVFRVGRSAPSTTPSRSLFFNAARAKDESRKDGKVLRMVMFGKPGAGKGTLSARLVKKYDIMSLSTGDILRQNILERQVIFHGEVLSVDLRVPSQVRSRGNGGGTRKAWRTSP